MDKYEFNIKVEQIKKLVNKGDFETAMKIADTIDWRPRIFYCWHMRERRLERGFYIS